MRQESGFGMLELLIALVVMNVGLFALIGAFNASTLSINRARNVSAATAVADKQMETYRGLQNCAIWLDQWLMPASNSAYAADTPSFRGTSAFSPQIPYWNAAGAADSQYWVTDGMDASNGFSQSNLSSCAYTSQTTGMTLPLTSTQGATGTIDTLGIVTPPSSTSGSAVRPVQTVSGPDGVKYTIYTYIVLFQPTSGEWTKQVTVTVRDPQNVNRVLARETSVFDYTVAP
jgi:type II secretory pathway pseudopilin PulG